MRIPRGAGLLPLALAGCLTTAQMPYSLANVYGDARAVALVPPIVNVRALIGRGAEYRWDLSNDVGQRLTAALRAAFEQRGLQVILLQDSPQTADPLYDARSSFQILLPSLLAIESSEIPPGAGPYSDAWLGDVSGLLEAAGADLLLLASAEGEALTTESVRSGVMAEQAFGISRPEEFLAVHVALVDRTGYVVFFRWRRSGVSPLTPGEVADAVERILRGIPRRS